MKLQTSKYINENAVTSDFSEGDIVSYIAMHKTADYLKSRDRNLAEFGVVKSTNDKFVFVRFVNNEMLQNTAQATDPKMLINHTTYR